MVQYLHDTHSISKLYTEPWPEHGLPARNCSQA